MANISGLVSLLEAVNLGGIINECVIKVDGDNCSCKAMDLTNTVFVETAAQLELDDCEFAVGNMPLLIKYLNTYANVSMDIKLDDNRMTFKPKGGGSLKFLLSKPDMIPTYDEEWGDESRAEQAMEEFPEDTAFTLTNEVTSEFINLIKMFGVKSVTIKVDKKKQLTVCGGTEADHNFVSPLGKSKFDECEIEIASANLLAVLSVLDYTEGPTMLVGPDKPIIISCGPSAWILKAISNE